MLSYILRNQTTVWGLKAVEKRWRQMLSPDGCRLSDTTSFYARCSRAANILSTHLTFFSPLAFGTSLLASCRFSHSCSCWACADGHRRATHLAPRSWKTCGVPGHLFNGNGWKQGANCLDFNCFRQSKKMQCSLLPSHTVTHSFFCYKPNLPAKHSQRQSHKGTIFCSMQHICIGVVAVPQVSRGAASNKVDIFMCIDEGIERFKRVVLFILL